MRDLEIKRILVPTDLSQQSIISLQYARFFAERFSSALTLFYVDPIVFPVDIDGSRLPASLASTPAHMAALTGEIHAWARSALAGMPYEVATAVGHPVPTIVREEAGLAADLVIMATHGLRGWRRLVLGSVTEGVLRRSACPVLSVNRKEGALRNGKPVQRIVCPVNFSAVARASLNYASQLAAAFECELAIVHVIENEGSTNAVDIPVNIRTWIDREVQHRCSYREIELRGGAAERVLDFAEDLDADLIVIGAQHKAFRDQTVIGTTTERLVRFATVPVLSVPVPVPAQAAAREELFAQGVL